MSFDVVRHLGATVSPLNVKYKSDEVVFYLTDVSCNLLVVTASELASKTGGGEGEVNLSSLSE